MSARFWLSALLNCSFREPAQKSKGDGRSSFVRTRETTSGLSRYGGNVIGPSPTAKSRRGSPPSRSTCAIGVRTKYRERSGPGRTRAHGAERFTQCDDGRLEIGRARQPRHAVGCSGHGPANPVHVELAQLGQDLAQLRLRLLERGRKTRNLAIAASGWQGEPRRTALDDLETHVQHPRDDDLHLYLCA